MPHWYDTRIVIVVRTCRRIVRLNTSLRIDFGEVGT